MSNWKITKNWNRSKPCQLIFLTDKLIRKISMYVCRRQHSTSNVNRHLKSWNGAYLQKIIFYFLVSRDRCHDLNFLRFLPIFGENNLKIIISVQVLFVVCITIVDVKLVQTDFVFIDRSFLHNKMFSEKYIEKNSSKKTF
jgi:hypothetical protein